MEDRDAERRFLWPIDLQQEEVRGAVSVPVPGHRSPYGVLIAAARIPRPFSLEDTTFLQSVSRILAAAVAQERYRHRVLEQESLARIGAMATVVAHEVRNPLGGISGAVQVLKGSVARDSEESHILDMILARIATLDDTISDLLAFARPRAPLIAPIEPKDLIGRATALFEKDPAHAAVKVVVEGQCRAVRCDRDQISAVLQNLLLNASHAMGGKGTITVNLTEVADLCRIAVRDQGPGIPESLRDKVFEPFFTTKRQGTGLGLATSRRMVEAHGGTLSATGSGEGGAVMVVSLPLEGPALRTAEATAARGMGD